MWVPQSTIQWRVLPLLLSAEVLAQSGVVEAFDLRAQTVNQTCAVVMGTKDLPVEAVIGVLGWGRQEFGRRGGNEMDCLPQRMRWRDRKHELGFMNIFVEK